MLGIRQCKLINRKVILLEAYTIKKITDIFATEEDMNK